LVWWEESRENREENTSGVDITTARHMHFTIALPHYTLHITATHNPPTPLLFLRSFLSYSSYPIPRSSILNPQSSILLPSQVPSLHPPSPVDSSLVIQDSTVPVPSLPVPSPSCGRRVGRRVAGFCLQASRGVGLDNAYSSTSLGLASLRFAAILFGFGFGFDRYLYRFNSCPFLSPSVRPSRPVGWRVVGAAWLGFGGCHVAQRSDATRPVPSLPWTQAM
jgi:hypothetical protein